MATWEENIANGVKSGYFNSIEKDRPYNAEDMTNYFEGLVTNGIYTSVGDALKVTSSGLTVTVGTGRAMIDCRWIRVTTPQKFTVSPPDSQSERVDLVVVKLDLSKSVRQMTIEYLTGTSTLPADTDEVKYLLLAQVTVVANAESVTITDMRSSTRCGFVTSISAQTALTHEIVSINLPAAAAGAVYPLPEDFNYRTDVFLAFKNGLFLQKGIDYELGSYVELGGDDMPAGTPGFKLLKPTTEDTEFSYIYIKGKKEEITSTSDSSSGNGTGGETS